MDHNHPVLAADHPSSAHGDPAQGPDNQLMQPFALPPPTPEAEQGKSEATEAVSTIPAGDCEPDAASHEAHAPPNNDARVVPDPEARRAQDPWHPDSVPPDYGRRPVVDMPHQILRNRYHIGLDLLSILYQTLPGEGGRLETHCSIAVRVNFYLALGELKHAVLPLEVCVFRPDGQAAAPTDFEITPLPGLGTVVGGGVQEESSASNMDSSNTVSFAHGDRPGQMLWKFQASSQTAPYPLSVTILFNVRSTMGTRWFPFTLRVMPKGIKVKTTRKLPSVLLSNPFHTLRWSMDIQANNETEWITELLTGAASRATLDYIGLWIAVPGSRDGPRAPGSWYTSTIHW